MTVLILWVAVLAAVPALSTAANEPADQERILMAREINQLMRRDLRTEALPLCRTYNERFPGDPTMLYNQACLENMTGQPEKAAATFGQAAAAGFGDFDAALADPDFEGLMDYPVVSSLIREYEEWLEMAVAERAMTLSRGEQSRTLPLSFTEPASAGGDPEILLTWTPTALAIELHATGPWSDLSGPDLLAPWNGGPGLVVTLGIPTEPGDARTTNHFIFAFGTESNRPIGAAYLAGQKRWQAIAEMQPKIRVDENDNLELKTMVPWAAILPYDPLVDHELGFNAALRVSGSGGPIQTELLWDPASFRPGAKVRRIVPLDFDAESISDDVFVGRVSRTISGPEPLTLDLVAVSGSAGAGQLTIDFLGGPEQSLLPEGKASSSLDLAKGLNRITRQADFSGLKTGAYVIKAELAFPSGRTLSWGSTVLQLAPGWIDEYSMLIADLPPHEEPTARYHLDTIVRAVENHHPRRGPGPIITTLDELVRLLDNAVENGSILPDQGTFLAVYPGPDGQARLCHIYLPPGWRIARRLNPVVTLTGAVGMAGAIADRMGQNYDQGRQKPTLKAGQDEGFPVYLVPGLAPIGDPRPADLNAEAVACLAWARETFDTPIVSVAGSDRGAGTALHIASGQGGTIRAMTIYAGRDLDPWPQAEREFIRERLEGFPTSIPLVWNDFITETRVGGQGPLILEVLQELGADIVEIQKVKGGMNFTQVADRTILWAENLR